MGAAFVVRIDLLTISTVKNILCQRSLSSSFARPRPWLLRFATFKEEISALSARGLYSLSAVIDMLLAARALPQQV